jgi:hypothetical protein
MGNLMFIFCGFNFPRPNHENRKFSALFQKLRIYSILFIYFSLVDLTAADKLIEHITDFFKHTRD